MQLNVISVSVKFLPFSSVEGGKIFHFNLIVHTTYIFLCPTSRISSRISKYPYLLWGGGGGGGRGLHLTGREGYGKLNTNATGVWEWEGIELS